MPSSSAVSDESPAPRSVAALVRACAPLAPRDARQVAAVVLGCTPAMLMHDAERPVDAADAERVLQAARAMLAGMPMAYAVGSAAFRHLELAVDRRVLIPRPETEVVAEHALRVVRDTPGGIAADIGTGSGAIALSLAHEGHFDRVIATDLSADALAVARANAERLAPLLQAPVEFRLGADTVPLAGERLRLLVSNPPYIAEGERSELPALVRDWEPHLALFAAEGGMARYRAILEGACAVLEPGGWVVLECDARRAEDTARLAESVGGYADITVYPDLAGRPRVLVARRYLS